MATNLDGIQKADAIRRIVVRMISEKAWRSEAEKDATSYLDWKTEKPRKAEVIAYVREQYDAAGAGPLGRWQ